VAGVGVHWYLNAIAPATVLDETHDLDPSKFILATEACAGSLPFEEKVILGSWERAEQYAADIIEVRATIWLETVTVISVNGDVMNRFCYGFNGLYFALLSIHGIALLNILENSLT